MTEDIYITVQFWGSERTYTYVTDIKGIEENDFVIVPVKHQEKDSLVKVYLQNVDKPSYAVSRVIKKVEV